MHKLFNFYHFWIFIFVSAFWCFTFFCSLLFCSQFLFVLLPFLPDCKMKDDVCVTKTIRIPTCKTVLQRSDKLVELHLGHGGYHIGSRDGLPALVLGHGVGLGRGVQHEHAGSLQQQQIDQIQSQWCLNIWLILTFVMATLASSVTLQELGRQSFINLETTGVGRLRSSGLSAIICLNKAKVQRQWVCKGARLVKICGWGVVFLRCRIQNVVVD